MLLSHHSPNFQVERYPSSQFSFLTPLTSGLKINQIIYFLLKLLEFHHNKVKSTFLIKTHNMPYTFWPLPDFLTSAYQSLIHSCSFQSKITHLFAVS